MTNHVTPNQTEYKLFVLRLWRPSPHEKWRLAIQPEDAANSRRLPTLDHLLQFVQEEMKEDNDTDS